MAYQHCNRRGEVYLLQESKAPTVFRHDLHALQEAGSRTKALRSRRDDWAVRDGLGGPSQCSRCS